MKRPVRTTYRGFDVVVDSGDIMVRSPFDGDLAFFSTMSGARRWVKSKRRESRLAAVQAVEVDGVAA